MEVIFAIAVPLSLLGGIALGVILAVAIFRRTKNGNIEISIDINQEK